MNFKMDTSTATSPRGLEESGEGLGDQMDHSIYCRGPQMENMWP